MVPEMECNVFSIVLTSSAPILGRADAPMDAVRWNRLPSLSEGRMTGLSANNGSWM